MTLLSSSLCGLLSLAAAQGDSVESIGVEPMPAWLQIDPVGVAPADRDRAPKAAKATHLLLELATLELMPGWIQSRKSGDWSPRVAAVPGAAFFRPVTVRWLRLVWTPLVTGLGFASISSGIPTAFWILGTEVGATLFEHDRHSLRLSLAVGGGGFRFTEVHESQTGRNGLILSPTVRYGYQAHAELFVGCGLRAFTVLPNQDSPGALGGLFFDLGWALIP